VSPTARSLALLREAGYLAAVVATWVPRVQVRRDLFGFADLLAFHPQQRVFLLVQCTSNANVASRVHKVKQSPAAAAWLAAGGQIEVHGWAKKLRRWHVRRVAVQLSEVEPLEAVEVQGLPRKRRERRCRELYDGEGSEVT
jgi:carbonic anhydrase